MNPRSKFFQLLRRLLFQSDHCHLQPLAPRPLQHQKRKSPVPRNQSPLLRLRFDFRSTLRAQFFSDELMPIKNLAFVFTNAKGAPPSGFLRVCLPWQVGLVTCNPRDTCVEVQFRFPTTLPPTSQSRVPPPQ